MMIPVAIYFLVYGYYPLIKGLQVSFQDYRLMGDGPYAGLANYSQVWHDPFFWKSLTNTLVIGGGILALGFIAPLVLALSLNEVLHARFKKTAQMVLYIPHLLSWVIVGGIWIFLLSPDTGLVNLLLQRLTGTQPIHFLAESFWARWVMILVATWKDMGYSCILFLAGIVTINPSLYEAARIDGASRWQQVRYVTLPQLLSTMKVVFLLNTMGVLRIFDQVYNMNFNDPGGPLNTTKPLVLMIYQTAFKSFDMGYAAAQTVVLFVILLAVSLIQLRVLKDR